MRKHGEKKTCGPDGRGNDCFAGGVGWVRDIMRRFFSRGTRVFGWADSRSYAGLDRESLTKIGGIRFMLEEEKLVRDVYLEMAELWGLHIFKNIAANEQSPMGAVPRLIEDADEEDPVESAVIGNFENPVLIDIHSSLK